MSDHSHDTEISNAAAVLLAAIRNRTTVGRDTVAVSGEAEGYADQ